MIYKITCVVATSRNNAACPIGSTVFACPSGCRPWTDVLVWASHATDLLCVVCIRVWSVSVLLCSLSYVQVSIHSSFCMVLLLSLSWSTHAACFAHIDKKMWKTYCHQFVHSPVDVLQGTIRMVEADYTLDLSLENNPDGRAR